MPVNGWFLLRFDETLNLSFKATTQPLVGEQRPVAERRDVPKCVGQIVVGDRDGYTVQLKGDTLTLGKSRYRKRTRHLQARG